MKRIKLALILAAIMMASTACGHDTPIEPVASESEIKPITIAIEKPTPEVEVVHQYIPRTESKVEYIQPTPIPMPEPEPESEPTAQVAMFEDNNQVVVEVVYEGNCYVGDVHEQLFQKNIGLSTEIPVYTLQGTFIPIEGFEGKTWYEFQGDAVWTLDESYLGFTPNESEEYTLFFSDNWTTETSTDDFFICVQDYSLYRAAKRNEFGGFIMDLVSINTTTF